MEEISKNLEEYIEKMCYHNMILIMLEVMEKNI